ncbi:hypothetical protein LR48_Vigan04g158200 [Vigna angularis]|uniref:Uncharacterized protein n=1 Tax=Phaseolus angularis TaxID=3914 RepID=A0A0L9UFQ7_PHAAN|nr:hypothetical protein LR48_Vigan04g158200 [Vigna angularis]
MTGTVTTVSVTTTGTVATMAEFLAIKGYLLSVRAPFPDLASLSALLSSLFSLLERLDLRGSSVTVPSEVSEISEELLCQPTTPEYDWVIMRAPRLLNLFPVPIIIDDDRDERQIPPPMLLTFRTRAPSTELSLRPPQPAREFFQF